MVLFFKNVKIKVLYQRLSPFHKRIPTDDESAGDVRADEFTPEDEWELLTYIGRETIDGVNTYVIIEQDNDLEITMWFHPEYGIPLRIESEGPDSEDQYVIEVINLELDHLTSEDFEVPEEYEIIEFGQ